jgi:type III secretion system HrpE/YscL family protein
MARVIRADQSGPQLRPKVIVDATANARAILERAREQAETELQRARETGRAQGRAELAAKFVELAAERDRALAALEPQAIEIAMVAAKRIVGHELSLQSSLVAEMVAPLLERVRRAQQITLRVHPDDGAALEANLAALRDRAGLAGSLRVEADATLERGDCVLHSDIGALDARIDTQLHALSRALRST